MLDFSVRKDLSALINELAYEMLVLIAYAQTPPLMYRAGLEVYILAWEFCVYACRDDWRVSTFAQTRLRLRCSTTR